MIKISRLHEGVTFYLDGDVDGDVLVLLSIILVFTVKVLRYIKKLRLQLIRRYSTVLLLITALVCILLQLNVLLALCSLGYGRGTSLSFIRLLSESKVFDRFGFISLRLLIFLFKSFLVHQVSLSSLVAAFNNE